MKNLFWLLVLIFVAFINMSFACTRFEFGVPIQAEFTRADAVFIGKAIKIEDLTGKDEYPDNWLKVQFKVQQNFKGAENTKFTIITNDWRAACGLKIKKGQTWIIYASYDEEDKIFRSNTGTKYNFSEDKDEVEILKAASERKTDTTISGRLISYGAYEYKYEPVEITVEGNGGQQTTTTKSDGTFSISALTAGSYKVKMKFPFRAALEHRVSDEKPVYLEGTPTIFEYEVKLNQGEYDYSFFEVFRYSK